MSSLLRQKDNPSKLSSQQYTYLTVKQIINSQPQFYIDFYTPIQQYIQPFNKEAQKIVQLQKHPQKRKQMIFQIVQRIKSEDPEYQKFKNMIKQKIIEKAQNISQMQTRKNTFSIDCLRQSMSIPFKKQKQNSIYNFIALFKMPLDKQMRRVLWQKTLINQKSKQQFFKYNHQITPYNIQKEFRIMMQRIGQKQQIKLKQSQKDLAIKLLECTVKKYKILPTRTEIYLSLNLVQLFSYYQLSKINDLGAIYCSLQQLANFYFQPNLEVRFNNIFKALELIDEQSHMLIQERFFSTQQMQGKSKLQLNQIYQNFRLSMTSKFLPLDASQYLIDQLLIKKQNKFDMYVLFAIVILVLGDHIQLLINSSPVNSPKKVQLLKNSARGNIDTQSNINNQNNSMSQNNQQQNVSFLQELVKKNQNSMKNKSLLSPNQELNSNNKSPQNSSRNNNQVNIQSPLKSKNISPNKSLLLDDGPISELQFRSIFADSKTIIKTSDIIESFSVLYQKIPAFYPSSYQLQQPNQLFQFLLDYQNQKPNYIKSYDDKKNDDQVEQQQLVAQLQKLRKKAYHDPQSFVKQSNTKASLRLGNPKRQNQSTQKRK